MMYLIVLYFTRNLIFFHVINYVKNRENEEMKSVFNLFFTKYNTFEENLTTANQHVNYMKKWKVRVGLTDISKLNGIYEDYKKKKGKKNYCSYCLKRMKSENDLDVYCAKHSMVNGLNVQECIREFWLSIQNAMNSMDEGKGFGNTEELQLRWDEEKKKRLRAYNNRIKKKNKKPKAVPKKKRKKEVLSESSDSSYASDKLFSDDSSELSDDSEWDGQV